MYFLEHYQVPVGVGSYVPVATKRLELEDNGLWEHNVRRSSQTANYLNDSLLSLVDTDQAKNREGSNHVRYGITLANIEIGLKHNCLLGVGSALIRLIFMMSLKMMKMERFSALLNRLILKACLITDPLLCVNTHLNLCRQDYRISLFCFTYDVCSFWTSDDFFEK